MGQRFPVKDYPRLDETRYQPGIGQALFPARRVDPDDPDPAEIPFPVTAITVRVEKALGNRIFGGFII
jgi:hypothetical protein